MNVKHKKWKRFLAVTLTAAMLAPNSSVLASASGADLLSEGIPSTVQSGDTIQPPTDGENGSNTQLPPTGENGGGDSLPPTGGAEGGNNGNSLNPPPNDGAEGGNNGNSLNPSPNDGAEGGNNGDNLNPPPQTGGNSLPPVTNDIPGEQQGEDETTKEPVTNTLTVEGNDYISQLAYTYVGEDPLADWNVVLEDAALTEEQMTAVNGKLADVLGKDYQEATESALYNIRLESVTGSEESAPAVDFQVTFKKQTDVETVSTYYINSLDTNTIDQLVLEDYPIEVTMQAGNIFGFVKAEDMPATNLTAEWAVNETDKISVTMSAAARAEVPEGAALTAGTSAVAAEAYQAALAEYVKDLKKLDYTAFDLSLTENDAPVGLANGKSARITMTGTAPWGAGTVKRLYYLTNAGGGLNAQPIAEPEFGTDPILTFDTQSFGTFVAVTGEEKKPYTSTQTVDGITFTVSSDDDEGIPAGAVLKVTKGDYNYTTENGLYQNYDMKLVDASGQEVKLDEGKNVTVTINSSADPIFATRGQLTNHRVLITEEKQSVEEPEKVETVKAEIPAAIKTDGDSYGAISSITYETDTVQPIEIRADRAATEYDMSTNAPASSWVKKVTLYRQVGSGKWAEVDQNYVFEDQDPIKMMIQVRVPYTPFDDENVYLYPGDTMKLQLPLRMKNATDQQNIAIKNGNDEMGRFSINDDSAGNTWINVNLNNKYLNLSDGKLGTDYQMEFQGSLDYTVTGEETVTETLQIGDVELKVPIKKTPLDQKAAVKLMKYTGDKTYVNDDKNAIVEYQEFRITLTAPDANTLPLHTFDLKDYFNDSKKKTFFTYVPYTGAVGAPILVLDEEKSKLITTKPSDISITSGVSEDGNLTGQITIGDKDDENAGLMAGEMLALKYKVKVDPTIYLPGANNSSVNTKVRNTAEVTTNHGTKSSDYEDVFYIKSMLEKKYDEKDDEGYAHYTVHINMNPLMDVSGYTLVDELLGENQTFQIDAKHPITLNYYNSSNNGTLLGTETVTTTPPTIAGTEDLKNQNIYYNQAGNLCINLSAKVPETDKTRGQCHIQLGYWTKVKLTEGQYQENLQNRIYLQNNGSGEGIGGHTINVEYAVYSIGKVAAPIDLLNNRIRWTSTLNAYPHMDVADSNYIPAGAIYEDKLSVRENASFHEFKAGEMRLSVKDKNGKELAEGDDYLFELDKESLKSFKITFNKKALAPVTISYDSYAKFGEGIELSDKVETYVNEALLTVNNWNTGAKCSADYQKSKLIHKTGVGYNRDTRELTWKVELNSGTYNLGDTSVSVKETLPEGLTLTKIAIEGGGEISLDECKKEGKNVWIIPVGKLGAKAKTLILTTKVADQIAEDNAIGETVKEYLNQANIFLGTRDYASSSAIQKVTYYTEDKLSQYKEGNTLTYSVYVNEKVQNLNPEGDTFGLKDTMEHPLALVPDSLKVYDLSEGKTDITDSCNLQLLDAKGSIFTLTLPDEKPLKIEYQASFAAPPGSDITLKNKAELYYEDTTIVEVEEESHIEVKKASGFGSGPVEIELHKVDQDNVNMKLRGAEFELYQYHAAATGNETWEQLSDLSNYRKMPKVYKDETESGNTDGIVEIPNVIQGVPYLVKETKAPEGYSYAQDIFYVFLVNKEGYSYSQVTDEKFFLLSAGQKQFYVRNAMAELAVDKRFTIGNSALKEGELPDGTYYFTVYTDEDEIAVTQSGQQAIGAITVQNGQVQKGAGETYALSFRLPYGTYTVYETDAQGKKLEGTDGSVVTNGNRFVVTDKTDNTIHSDKVTVNEHSVPAVAKVTNQLTEEPLKIKAMKLLKGRALKDGEFKFTVKEKTSNQKVAEGTNDKNGVIQFSPINYRFSDKNKTYSYLVEEAKTNNGGVAFGKNTFELEVKVGAKEDGTVKIESVKCLDPDRTLTADAEGYYQIYKGSEETAFVNVYAAKGSLQLEAKKTVTGAALVEQKFDFTVSKYVSDGKGGWNEAPFKTEDGRDGDTFAATQNNNRGQIQFPKDYFELDDIGEYKYVVEEKDSKLTMYDKDSSRYEVYVKVSDGGDGTLKFDKTIKKLTDDGADGNKVKNITFNNIYKAKGSFTPTVQKVLQGRDIKEKQFSFRLEAAKADWTSASFDLSKVEFEKTEDTDVKNDGDGKVTFSEITYQLEGKKSDAGYYIYKITENLPKGAEGNKYKGYTYASDPVYLYVEVKDAGEGVLEAVSYSDTEKNTNPVTLTNLYEAAGTVLLNGTKKLEGTAIQKDQFTFTLWGAKKATQPEKEEYDQIGEAVKNDENGSFAFPAIDYKADSGKPVKDVVGTYWYRIQEEIPTPVPEGYAYCSDGIKEYVIKVVVTEDSEETGKLKVVKTLADGTELPDGGAVFTNAYKSEGQWDIKAEKVLKGTPLVEGRYTFTLKDAAGNVLQTAANKADGTIAFTPVTYTQADMQNAKTQSLVYYIQEVVPDKVPGGVTYDKTLYKVYITLTDDGKGHIAVSEKTVTVSEVTETTETEKEETEETEKTKETDVDKIRFTNTFNGSVSLTKTAEDGVTTLSGVTFELYAKTNASSSYRLYGTYTTDRSGGIYVSGLPENEYYFVETKAADGYVIETDAYGSPVRYPFTISMSGKGGTSVSYALRVRNQKAYGKAELTKTDADTGKKLRDVEFALYTAGGLLVPVVETADGSYAVDSGASNDAVTSMKTDGSGRIKVTNLEWGTYYFKETKALAGYLPTDHKFTFVIDESSFDKSGGVYVAKTIEVAAVNKGTTVDILKVDEEGRAVKDAVLAVRDPATGEILDQWTSTGKPHTIYGVLSPGKTYYLEEISAPEGYYLASPVEFTVGTDGTAKVTLVNEKKDGDAGEIRVDKRISVLDEDFNEVDLVAANATYYVGLFTDPEGKHPYGDNHIKKLHIKNASSSGAAVYKDLPSGTYYVLEVEKDGTPIPMDELQGDPENGGFVCTVDGDTNEVTLDLKQDVKDGFIHLNNRYYDIPTGFSQRVFIDITKKVLRGTEEFTADDTFYAGVFTKSEDGGEDILYTVVELEQNGTVSVEVPLGGENGDEPVDYYVYETDADGNKVSGTGFAYEVSGEGKVTVRKENASSAITITNQVPANELGIQKVDESGNTLAGAQFKLVSADESYVEEWTSDSGIHKMNLEPGTYTLIETAAPNGYIKGGNVTVTVKEDGTITASGNDARVSGQTIQYVNKKSGSTSTGGGNNGTTVRTSTNYSSSTNNVKTGDETDIMKYLYLLAAGVVLCGLAAYFRRKKHLDTKE